MIKKLLFTFICAAFSSQLFGQYVSIPDANFKAYLLANSAINTNGDGEIHVDEAAAFSGAISCSNLNISSLTGIEAFVNISELQCYFNQLTSLDLSANTHLATINLYSNQLTSLILGNNSSWMSLSCGVNQLTSLDVSGCTHMVSISCESNELTSLDISALPYLTSLNCSNNALTSLNLANGSNVSMNQMMATNNPDLTCIQVDNVAYSNTYWTNFGYFTYDPAVEFSLNCSVGDCIVNIPSATLKFLLVNNTSVNTNQNLEIECEEAASYTGSLDLSTQQIQDFTGIEAFINLTSLNCAYNPATNLDLSANTILEELYCEYMNLTSLNVVGLSELQTLNCSYNQLISLDLGGCSSLNYLDCSNNGIETLDLSNQSVIEDVYCSNNFLTALNINNGNNAVIDRFFTQNNPYLTCIQVDDAAWSVANWTNPSYFGFNAESSFSEDCSASNVNAPTNLTAQTDSNEMLVTLQWEDVSASAFGFSIERSLDGETYSEIGVVSSGVLTYVDDAVDVNTTYYYRVRAFSEGEYSDYSNVVSVVIIPNEVLEMAESKINVYPNPATSALHVSIVGKNEQVQILDATGHVVVSLLLKDGVNTLNLDGWANGLYMIHSSTGAVLKFIKE